MKNKTEARRISQYSYYGHYRSNRHRFCYEPDEFHLLAENGELEESIEIVLKKDADQREAELIAVIRDLMSACSHYGRYIQQNVGTTNNALNRSYLAAKAKLEKLGVRDE